MGTWTRMKRTRRRMTCSYLTLVETAPWMPTHLLCQQGRPGEVTRTTRDKQMNKMKKMKMKNITVKRKKESGANVLYASVEIIMEIHTAHTPHPRILLPHPVVPLNGLNSTLCFALRPLSLFLASYWLFATHVWLEATP